MFANLTRAVWIGPWVFLAATIGCARSDSADRATAKAEAASEPQLDPTLIAVTLQLNWFPEAEHGGYFAALAEGYYQEAGLNVKILPGGPDTPVIQQVARRAVTFGIANADNILLGRAHQAPVVSVFAPLQISPRCILVHESSGITDFDGLKNLTIALSNSNPFAYYLRHKLPLPGVTVVPYPGNVAQFLLNKDYAQQGYVFSEPFVARKAGADPRVLMLSDLGYNPYSSTLFTSDGEIADHADIVRRMVAASARGWARYVQAPDAANRLIHKVNPEMAFDILEFGAKTLKPLVINDVAEQEGIGSMSRARWQTLADQLVESGQLKPDEAHVDEAFTSRFLKPAE
jgi:NitT/TauT family transport system substrate-binding protein